VTAAVQRLIGFVVLVSGIGLRLDTSWQRTAFVLILAGGAVVVRALWREASVSGPAEE
jgi:hypothetical protein